MFLVLIGLLVTVIWLIGGFWYISESGGLEMLAMLLPNEVGDFLTGLFAPLAFVWLIIGYLHFSLRLRRIENGLWDVSAVRIPRADEPPPDRPLDQQGGWLDPPPDDEPPPDKGPPPGGSSGPTDGAPADKAKAPPERAAKPAKGAKSKRGGSSKTSSRYRGTAWPQGDRSSWTTPPSSEPRPGRRFAASATRYPPQPQSQGAQSSEQQSAERKDGGPRRGGWFGATSRTILGRSPNPSQDEQTSQGLSEPTPEAPPPEVPPEARAEPSPEPSPGPSPGAQETPASGGMASEVFASRMRRQFEGDASPGRSERGAGRFGARGVSGSAEMPDANSAAPTPRSEVAQPNAADASRQQPVTSAAEPKTSPPVSGKTVMAAPPDPKPAEDPSIPANTVPGTSSQAADERPFVPPWPGTQMPPVAMAQDVPPEMPPAPGPASATPEPPPQDSQPAPTVAAAAQEVAAPEVAATESPTPKTPVPEAQAPRPAVEAPPPVAEAKPVGFRHLVRITSMELNTISMDLASLLCRESDRAVALKGYDKGEKDVFFGLLTKTLEDRDAKEVLQTLLETGADSRLGSYTRKFEALAEESKRVDKSGALAKSLEALPIGRLYQRIRAVKETGSAA